MAEWDLITDWQTPRMEARRQGGKQSQDTFDMTGATAQSVFAIPISLPVLQHKTISILSETISKGRYIEILLHIFNVISLKLDPNQIHCIKIHRIYSPSKLCFLWINMNKLPLRWHHLASLNIFQQKQLWCDCFIHQDQTNRVACCFSEPRDPTSIRTHFFFPWHTLSQMSHAALGLLLEAVPA